MAERAWDETITWHSAERVPDSDRSVLICAPGASDPVWVGFWDGDGWVSDGLIPYAEGAVRAWAELPAGAVP